MGRNPGTQLDATALSTHRPAVAVRASTRTEPPPHTSGLTPVGDGAEANPVAQATGNEGDHQPAGGPGTKVTARLFVSSDRRRSERSCHMTPVTPVTTKDRE